MIASGFGPLQAKSPYLMSSYGDNSNDWSHIGQIRICFEYDKCGPATVIAQQVSSQKFSFALRTWDPQLMTPAETKAIDCSDSDVDDTNFCSTFSVCCCLCSFISRQLMPEFETKLQFVRDGHLTSDEFFGERRRKLFWRTVLFEAVGALASTAGFLLIFSSTLEKMTWVPLAKTLIEHQVCLASLVLAAICAVTLSLAVAAMAWLVYKPRYSMLLLLASGISVYFIFTCSL